MHRLARLLTVCLFAIAVGLNDGKAHGQATFTLLGDLPGGGVSSKAFDVSADGSVVVGSAASGNGTEAFRWNASGGMVGLGDLSGGGFQSEASGVSADGSTVVGYGDTDSGSEAFRWTAGSGLVGIGDLAGGLFGSSADGISADGAVIVGAGTPAALPFVAMRWTSPGGMVSLGALPGSTGSMAFDSSADGSVVVGAVNYLVGGEAFRWTAAGGLVGLGDLPGSVVASSARAVSADGSVIVGTGKTSNIPFEAFRWTAGGGMVSLGDLPGGAVDSSAADVSADGSVVVGTGETSSGDRAFYWTQALGMIDLQSHLIAQGATIPTGLQFWEATAVSADGLTIVGSVFDANFIRQAWVARIPEPGAWVMGVLGGDCFREDAKGIAKGVR